MSAPAAKAFSLPVTMIAPMPAIGIEFGCGGGDFDHHLAVEGVERLGPVQRDGADAALAGDQDGLVAHGCLLLGECQVGIGGCEVGLDGGLVSTVPACAVTTSGCGPCRRAARGCPRPGRAIAARRTTSGTPGAERLPVCPARPPGGPPRASPPARWGSGVAIRSAASLAGPAPCAAQCGDDVGDGLARRSTRRSIRRCASKGTRGRLDRRGRPARRRRRRRSTACGERVAAASCGTKWSAKPIAMASAPENGAPVSAACRPSRPGARDSR